MSDAIFLSYRRDDSEGEAGRLYDDLIRIFGTDAVFMDVSDIHPGKDYRQAIDDNVAKCTVLLAIIGPGWTTIKDATGSRRLDQPNDFVRLEIASALTRGIDVIPVLVHGASMPAASDLPDNLQNLAYRNCIEITHVRWNSDVEVLSRALRDYVKRGDAFATRSIHMAITGETPAIKAEAQKPAEEPAPAKPAPRLMRTAGLLIVLVAAAIIGAASYAYLHKKPKHHDKKEAESAQTSIDQGSASTSTGAATSQPASSPASAATPAAADSASSRQPSPAIPAGANQQHLQALAGTWVNPQAQNGKPKRVQIAAEGDLASVHLWTRCGPQLCDLGTKSVPLSGNGITMQWTGPFGNALNERIVSQTASMRIYPMGAGLHMIYTMPDASTGFDFVRKE